MFIQEANGNGIAASPEEEGEALSSGKVELTVSEEISLDRVWCLVELEGGILALPDFEEARDDRAIELELAIVAVLHKDLSTAAFECVRAFSTAFEVDRCSGTVEVRAKRKHLPCLACNEARIRALAHTSNGCKQACLSRWRKC